MLGIRLWGLGLEFWLKSFEAVCSWKHLGASWGALGCDLGLLRPMPRGFQCLLQYLTKPERRVLLELGIRWHKATKLCAEKYDSSVANNVEKDDLPQPWERHWSTEYSFYYYWNSETGDSCWDRPADSSS